jgi:hypothetical protein
MRSVRLLVTPVGLIVCGFVAAGCDDKEAEVRTYSAPKETAAATAPASSQPIAAVPVMPQPAAATTDQPIRWTLPSGWQQDPQARPMRVATLTVDANGKRGELIVTRFRVGGFGSLVDNLNRWRQQVGLAPVADAGEVKAENATVGGSPAKVYDFSGTGADAKRNRVAMVETAGGDVWFFRFFGPADLIEAQRGNLDAFLQSVKFDTQG